METPTSARGSGTVPEVFGLASRGSAGRKMRQEVVSPLFMEPFYWAAVQEFKVTRIQNQYSFIYVAIMVT